MQHKNSFKWIYLLLIITFCFQYCLSTPLMIEHKNILLQSINKTHLAVFFYGYQNSLEYQTYEKMIPSDREIFVNLTFYFIPADKFKLGKPIPSFQIFRYVDGHEWLTYDGPYQVDLMAEWVRHNCHDALPEITPTNIDQLFAQGRKGLILLDSGQFQLLRTKITLNDYCIKQKLLCRKCTFNNVLLNTVIQLMRAQQEPGVARLGYYDPKSGKFQLYNRKKISLMTNEDIIEFVEGRQGIIRSGFTEEPINIVQDQL